MKLAELNDAPAATTREALTACCGSARWVDGMIARRPFRSVKDLLKASDDLWWSLGREDWLEAFAHHPRIGERSSAIAQNEQGKSWSLTEQSAVVRAPVTIRLAQQELNAQYERRFGYIYIVSAVDKTPDELLAIARERLSNGPQTELKVAADEQRKITRLRLEKLLEVT